MNTVVCPVGGGGEHCVVCPVGGGGEHCCLSCRWQQ